MLKFSESGHSVFRGSSALERGDLKSKGKRNLSFHFCGDDISAELVLHTIISVNQLSICGAVADMCDELACRISVLFRMYRENCCSGQSRNRGYPNIIDDHEQITSDR